MNLKPGSRLGRFTIVSRLGSGGMGEIYLANDERVGRSVAIKVLPKHLQADADARVRFEREALAASSLNHPNILTIYEFGEQQFEGMRHLTRFIVSEFIEGETLRNLMAHEKEGRKILEYLAQVADALAKAHSAGIIHRDLKPENIMITSDGYAKVLDFGLVKHIASKGVSTTKRSVTSGYVLSTVGYVSPEQASGQPIDHRSDIFAFGCILYEVLAGRRPFDARGLAETLHHVIHRKPDPLPNDVPRDVRKIVDRCLAKGPDDRYPSMKLVAEDLRGAAKSFIIPTPAPRRTKTRSTGHTQARPSAHIRSVAILPFVNGSDNAEMDSLSDGLTERIILSLSQVQKLKVMARRTVLVFKGTKMTPRQIARELRVGYVVTGRVQQRGDELLVSIELVNARDGSQIWGDRYRRQFSDGLDLVEEIAAQISEDLKVQLGNLEKRRLARRPVKRGEAYKLYLQGRYQASRRTPEGVRNAIRSFGDAIAIDPNYALAWSGLADSYAILSVRALAAPEEGYANLEEAARRAVALDPTLAEPHATLAALQFLYYWNWPEAEKEYRQALELDAGYPTTHHWYSSFLASMGRHEESVREATIAVDLDPLSVLLHVHLADMLYYAGRLDESLQQTRRTLALDENFFLGHWMLGRLSEARGDAATAAGHYEQAARLAGDYPGMLAALAGAKVATEDRDGAEKILADLQSRPKWKFVSPRFVAEVHLALGDHAATLEALKRFFHQRGELEEVLVGPRFEKIRRDPGFKEMLKGVGFPDTPIQ